MRSDTRRSIKRILEAAGEEMLSNPAQVTLQSIAARAGIGKATVYRHFSSLDDLWAAYMVNSMSDLADFSTDSELSGPELFRTVMTQWVELVLMNGRVMVQLRSRAGYLERLDRGDPVIATSLRIWERPIAELLADSGQTLELLRYALFLCNVLADPREISDLHSVEKLTAAKIAIDLESVLRGALVGWSHIDSTPLRQSKRPNGRSA